MSGHANFLTEPASAAIPRQKKENTQGEDEANFMNSNIPFATLPDLSARIIRRTVQDELKVGWDGFCNDYQLKPIRLDDGMSELMAQDELQLQRGFVDLTSDRPDLWFGMGLRYRSIKLGPMGLAMMTSSTLGEALEVACRYQALTYSLNEYRYVAFGNGACAMIVERSKPDALLYDFTQHRDLGTVSTLIADIMAGQPVLERVSVAAPAPPNWATLSRLFPCPVQFDATRTEWTFLPGSADRPLPLADLDLTLLYTTRCDDLVRRSTTDVSVRQRLLALLAAAGSQMPSAGDAARQLALSERTMHRRLSDEKTRFSEIIDKARFCRACDLLGDRRVTVETIAAAVGFAEPSSFSRAFRRWSGISALEYRRRNV